VITMTDRRVVLVLGPRAGEGPHLAPDDVVGASEVIVISIGWPLRPAQDRAVRAALALARTRRVVIDAILATSAVEAAGYVGLDDRILVDGSSRDRRTIRRAFEARGISVLPAR
jgi:hypothetical protein